MNLTQNRIDQLFREKEDGILSVFLTAGYPGLEDTVPLLKAIQEAGADLVEIGFPFSDPLADGPVIQGSNQIALKNGMSLQVLFRQLEGIRKHLDIPLILMGYLNPVLRMGMSTFLGHCRDSGIDGLILPDLPPEEYAARYRTQFQEAGLHHIMLISPQTEAERIRYISDLSGGFLYLVADAATTGAKDALEERQLSYFRKIRDMKLGIPGLIGFGISNRQSFRLACQHAAGAIIGSAFIRALGERKELSLHDRAVAFVRQIKAS